MCPGGPQCCLSSLAKWRSVTVTRCGWEAGRRHWQLRLAQAAEAHLGLQLCQQYLKTNLNACLQVIFQGPRVKMGIYTGTPTKVA